MRRLRTFARDRRGATAVEYALICTLIVVAAIAGISNFAGATVTLLNNVASNVVHSG